MRVTFPLREATGFHTDDMDEISPFRFDAAALHIMASAVQSFIDRVLRRQENIINPAAMLHFQKGLRLLRERLLGDKDEMKASDSTVLVVLKPTGMAQFYENYQVSKQHMEGLRKMVDLRGVPDVFRGKRRC